jgi:pilus assembly protein Flp/PilA
VLRLWKYIQNRSSGQTLVEYGLLLALIAVIVVVALLFLGPIVSAMFQNIGQNLNSA